MVLILSVQAIIVPIISLQMFHYFPNMSELFLVLYWKLTSTHILYNLGPEAYIIFPALLWKKNIKL